MINCPAPAGLFLCLSGKIVLAYRDSIIYNRVIRKEVMKLEELAISIVASIAGAIAAEAVSELAELLKERRKAKRKASAKAGKHAKRP